MASTPPSIWSDARLSPGKTEDDNKEARGHRTKFEQDFDRILFSAPVRRLSEKTQVFPLDSNDAVRNRLTHSHEVANLSRSIGARIYNTDPGAFEGQDNHRIVEPILGAIGLAHDLGNPPFGHQGEAAISNWFSSHKTWIFNKERIDPDSDTIEPISQQHQIEFTKFDGNPQSIRLLTRLHASQGQVGLDLTAATLMALLKYPISSATIDRDHAAKKKYGYFHSEYGIVEWAREKTGLKEGQRHPLTWIMEAADDTAYSVLDVEDAMKKGIISPHDLLNILKCDRKICSSVTYERINSSFQKVDELERSPVIKRDIKIQYVRAYLITELLEHASNRFLAARDAIFAYDHGDALMDDSPLCERLKNVAREYAFGNPDVLFLESKGRGALEALMDHFWNAIADRNDPEDMGSPRFGALPRFVHSLISPNYLEAALAPLPSVPQEARAIRYRELRLLTDMISGMTDTYALSLADHIRSIQ